MGSYSLCKYLMANARESDCIFGDFTDDALAQGLSPEDSAQLDQTLQQIFVFFPLLAGPVVGILVLRADKRVGAGALDGCAVEVENVLPDRALDLLSLRLRALELVALRPGVGHEGGEFREDAAVAGIERGTGSSLTRLSKRPMNFSHSGDAKVRREASIWRHCRTSSSSTVSSPCP